MEAKLFKNFHVIEHALNSAVNLDELHNFEAVDPTGGSWRTMGFVPVDVDNELTMDVQGAALLVCVQVNERILPGAVLREKMVERIASIQAREGRKLGKKEYAQIRDEIEFELLPTAFIRRKLVPIMFTNNNRTLIFTASAKLCDDIFVLLMRACPGYAELKPQALDSVVKNSIAGTLTTLAKDGQTDMVDDDDRATDYIGVANAAVLKGDGKKTIRIKDKNIAESDMQALLKQDYTVTALRLDFFEANSIEDEAATFTLNEHLVISALVLANIDVGKEKGKAEEFDKFMATAWAVAIITHQIIEAIIRVMGGYRDPSEVDAGDELIEESIELVKSMKPVTVDDDDDEL
jgi:DNA recombination-dependent growth factor C